MASSLHTLDPSRWRRAAGTVASSDYRMPRSPADIRINQVVHSRAVDTFAKGRVAYLEGMIRAQSGRFPPMSPLPLPIVLLLRACARSATC